ncbi:SigB/SigF/SigG family RNA polymerase sigma factor [Streptomyces sp. NPDC057910]|uniref:SigB/SigF/SigG family RNA polymerase sigma factor n=1 Tax=Streptomyces sp. NPDC057910 TaxID=3346278 RepID=UPI0036DFF02D
MTTPVTTCRSYTNEPNTADLFERLRRSPEGAEHDHLRTELVQAWLPMAHRLAGRYRNRGQDIEDLRQVAALGLLKAINRYDPARGAFGAYATPMIDGELKRHFRDYTWVVHVPRRVQELSNRVRHARQELLAGRPGEPSPAELASYCGLPEDDVRLGLEAAESYATLSLDADLQNFSDTQDARNLADTLGAADERFTTIEIRECVRPVLGSLPEREKLILHMRFFQDMPQQIIAKELGISQMHVSRLITRTCTRIKEEIAGQS